MNKDRILKRLDEFIEDAKIESQVHFENVVLGLRVFLGNFLEKDNYYLVYIKRELGWYSAYNHTALQLFLKRVRADVDDDLIYNIRKLISSELFDSFLDEADYLLQKKIYKSSCCYCWKCY